MFQQLVGEYALWFSAGSDPSDISALLVSGVEDPGTVVNALSQLTLLIQGAAGGTASVTTRQIGGDQVSVIDTGDPTAPALEYGIVDDHFVFGVGTAVDDFADGPVDSLADDAQFQDVMATLPEDVNGMLYVDLARIIPLIQEAASSASAPTAVEEIVDASPDCANYETQEEAQEAYDAGEEGTFDLDQDFDGEVCEDFFADEDGGVGLADLPDEEAQPFVADLSAITAFALVAYDDHVEPMGMPVEGLVRIDLEVRRREPVTAGSEAAPETPGGGVAKVGRGRGRRRAGAGGRAPREDR